MISIISVLGERSRLIEGAIPSVFNFLGKSQMEESSPRRLRLEKRLCTQMPAVPEVQMEVEVEEDSGEAEQCELQTEPAALDKEIQCNLSCMDAYSIENFELNPKAVSYYTGFNDYNHFMAFYYCLGPSVDELSYQCSSLSPKNQLFLTIMKLRQGKEDFELSLLFKISIATVSRVITTWINFMFFQLKELQIWPSKEIVQDHMPQNFYEKFPSTRVILDATECPIQKPSNVNNQATTWSTYKHRNTVKAMIGCTPRGAISYISDAFGGSTSDRQIIERSDLLKPDKHMFEPGDSIMADRGIMVQDLFASQDVYVNTPTMLKGRSQLDPEEIVRDRRVASKRIHIERVIGLAKKFKILKRELCQSKVPLASRILFVCFAITNFRNSIVDKFA